MANRSGQPQADYFGASASRTSKQYLWIFRDGRLWVEVAKEHGKDVSIEGPGMDRFWRGWYDPQRREMLTISPRRQAQDTPHRQGEIPGVLDRSLRRRFGDHFRYRLF